MYNVVNRCQNLHHLVQLGIRDVSEAEVLFAASHPKIKTFYDWQLKSNEFKGTSWDQQCDNILEELSEKVYISFDIDGLYPYLCPHTGTPVAGGFSLEHISYLLFKLVGSGKSIIGFDLNEVSPGSDGDWDANVGARALWQLVCASELSRRKHVREN
jgi:agmatinase